MGRYNADFAYSEYLTKEDLNSKPDNTVLFSLKNHSVFEFYNSVNKKATTIKSKVDSEYINNRESLNFLVTRSQDVKYYLRTENKTSVIGKIDKNIMVVTMR